MNTAVKELSILTDGLEKDYSVHVVEFGL